MVERYDIFDISKFVLSIAIVAIHSCIWPVYIYPWVRLATPLFFVISSFLFFSRNKENEKAGLKKFVARNLKLYFFWLIVLAFDTTAIKQWFSEGFINGCGQFVYNFFLGSTYHGSWFIMSLILDVVLVYLMKKIFPSGFIIFIACMVWIFITLCCNWHNVFTAGIFANSFIVDFIPQESCQFTNFGFGFIWIVLGKIFADDQNFLKNGKKILLLACLSTFVIDMEWRELAFDSKNVCSVAFFSMPFVVAAIFAWMLSEKDLKIEHGKIFRKMSVHIFILHLAFVEHTYGFISDDKVRFVALLIISIALSAVIQLLEKIKWLKWLKYSY